MLSFSWSVDEKFFFFWVAKEMHKIRCYISHWGDVSAQMTAIYWRTCFCVVVSVIRVHVCMWQYLWTGALFSAANDCGACRFSSSIEFITSWNSQSKADGHYVQTCFDHRLRWQHVMCELATANIYEWTVNDDDKKKQQQWKCNRCVLCFAFFYWQIMQW